MGLVLVFDADDTLWENEVRFERVVEDFLAWLAHPTLNDVAIRTVLNDVEAANVVAHGYGSRSFLRSLHDCFERLHKRPGTDQERREIEALAAALVEHRVELVPEVADTLTALGRRHTLALLTKGDREEQQGKIDASGLADHFDSIHIVAEKNVEVYQGLARQLSVDPAMTWMIGNSPKSDILPARRAGWNAAFIPNEHTWVLEQGELDPEDNAVLRLAAFKDLLAHF
jgi:putative hydrolase of the HAD superfamily